MSRQKRLKEEELDSDNDCEITGFSYERPIHRDTTKDPDTLPRRVSSISRLYDSYNKRISQGQGSSVPEGGARIPSAIKSRKEEESTSTTYSKREKDGETEISRSTVTTRKVSEEFFGGAIVQAAPAEQAGSAAPAEEAGAAGSAKPKTRREVFYSEGPQTFTVNENIQVWKDALENEGFSDENILAIIEDVKSQFSIVKTRGKYNELVDEAFKRNIAVQDCDVKAKGKGLFALSSIKCKRGVVTVPVGGEFNPGPLNPGDKDGDANNAFSCHVSGMLAGRRYKIDGTLYAKNSEIYRVNHGCPHCEEANCNFSMREIKTKNNSAISLMCVQTNGPIEVESGRVEILVSYNILEKHEDPARILREAPWLKCSKCGGEA